MVRNRKHTGIIALAPGKYRVIARIRKDGKIFHKQATITGTVEQAKELFQKFKAELRGSLTVKSDPRTFSEILDLYAEGRDFSPLHKYRVNYIKREIGDFPLNGFADRFKAWLKIRRSTVSSTTGKRRSAADQNRIVEVVRAAFNVAVESECLDKNPITKTLFPRLREISRDVVLSEIDQNRLLNTIEKEAPHLSAIVRFALQVPCRRSELVNMRHDDLDLFNNVIRIRNGTTKNDHGTWKPIPPDLVEYFRSIPAESEYLFYRKTSTGYVKLGDFKTAWNRCKRLAGVTWFHFHDTRHVAASALVNRGVPEQVVMDVAGWRTNMLRTYYHRDPIQSLSLIKWSQCDSDVIASGHSKVYKCS